MKECNLYVAIARKINFTCQSNALNISIYGLKSHNITQRIAEASIRLLTKAQTRSFLIITIAIT